MKRKTNWLLLLSLPMLAASCSKKYTCTHHIAYSEVGIIYKGFSASDLSHVVVQTYAADGSFSNPLSTDTMDFSSDASFSNDTAFKQGDYARIGLYFLVKGKDYRLTVLSTNQVYKFSDIHEGDASETWTQDTQCSPGASQDAVSVDMLNLNGQPAKVLLLSLPQRSYAICLSH